MRPTPVGLAGRLMLVLPLLAAAPLGAADVRTDKDVYNVLDPITVTFSGMPGNSNDWISVAKASFAPRDYLQYFYTGGKTSGSFAFNALQEPGDYVARAYFKNTNDIQAQKSFRVIFPTPVMSTDKSRYLVLEPVTVTYSNLPGFPDDYLTIVPASSPDSTYWEYYKTGGAKSGAMKFQRQLDPGEYEARLHFRNEDPIVRSRVRFSVEFPSTQIRTDKTSYVVGEKIVVTYSAMPGYPNDYITIVPANAADDTYWEYYKAAGAKSGTMTFSRALEPGKYEARVHYRNEDGIVRVRTAFTVAFPNTTVRTDKASYQVGEKIVVTYTDMAGYPDDYITVVPATSPDSTFWEYYRASGAKSGTMTFTRKLDPGRYEARVHYRNEDAVVRARAGFAVGAAPCNITLSPGSATVASSGGSGTISLTAGADCAWSAASSDPAWLTVSPTSGTGDSTLRYTAGANASAGSRTARVTVSGQTFTLTQATAACTFAISHAQTTVKAAGGTGGVLVTAASGCSWTAASNDAWITIASGASGSGSGTVNYSVAPNTGAARTGTLTIAGRTFTINQDASQDQILITRGGVVNAASFMPADLPGGAIAQGAIFTILGERLGPEQSVSAGAYPIETRLAEVGVAVTGGGATVEAYPLMVSATRIDAVLPSGAPLGDAQVTVTYGGKTSGPAAIRIVASNFAPFGAGRGRGPAMIYNYLSDAEQPLNTTVTTARPGQRVALRGTGLGAIAEPDNMAPPAGELSAALEVYVAHKPARKISAGRATAVPPGMAGVDQVVFELPADTPAGCYVPVQVKTAVGYSNVVTMAVEPQGNACSDSVNPFSDINTKGRKGGSIFLVRANAIATLEPDKPPADITLDFGIGMFQESSPGGEQGFNPLFALPPVGTCTGYTGAIDAGALLGGSSAQASGKAFPIHIRLRRRARAPRAEPGQELLGKELDAGTSLTVSASGGAGVPLPHLDPDANTGPYVGLLGGTVPVEGAPVLPLFLNPGTFTVTGAGGKDVGAFTASVVIPPPVTWTNRDRITEVDRASDLTLTWSGGSADTLVIIGGLGSDQKTSASGGFFCFVPAEPGRFTVPASVMGNLPATGTNLQESAGALIIGTTPLSYSKFTATGLDSGLLLSGALSIKTVQVK